MGELEAVHVYSNGPIHCSVCVPKAWQQSKVEREVNLVNPTGISSEWKVSDDKQFKTGEDNPCECD